MDVIGVWISAGSGEFSELLCLSRPDINVGLSAEAPPGLISGRFREAPFRAMSFGPEPDGLPLGEQD
jgi:hypothetical protein